MISLCMIVRNEQYCLDKCLENIQWPITEVIIVDTGSTDKTIEIAKRYTNKVYILPFCDDFSEARNYSISKATNKWILVLDADEYMNLSDIKALEKEVRNMESQGFFGARIWNYDYYQNGGWSVRSITRLFKNDPSIYYERSVNETISFTIQKKNSDIMVTPLNIHHTGYLKKSDYIEYKHNRYTTLLKKDIDLGDDTLRYYYAKEHMLKHDTKRAFELCNEAMNIKVHTQLINLKGDIYLEEEKYDLAEKCYKEVLQRKHQYMSKFYFHAVNRLAEISFMIGKYEKALEWYSLLGEKGRKLAHVLVNTALIYEKMGQFENSLQYYKAAININPEIVKYDFRFQLEGHYTDTFMQFKGVKTGLSNLGEEDQDGKR